MDTASASVPLFHGGNQKVGLLCEVERLLQIALTGGLISLGEEQARILKRLAIHTRQLPLAKTVDPLLNPTL